MIVFSLIGRVRVRIDGNSCIDNDWGIQDAGINIVDAFIVRNFCSGNATASTKGGDATSNYDFSREFQGGGGKTYGFIIGNRGEVNSSDFNGDNPWANFEK